MPSGRCPVCISKLPSWRGSFGTTAEKQSAASMLLSPTCGLEVVCPCCNCLSVEGSTSDTKWLCTSKRCGLAFKKSPSLPWIQAHSRVIIMHSELFNLVTLPCSVGYRLLSP